MHPFKSAHPRPGNERILPRRQVLRAGLGASAALAAVALLPASAQASDDDWQNTHSGSYDRDAAVSWAYNNWNQTPTFRDDCTYFCSQALWAGGLPQTDEWTEFGSALEPDLLADKSDLIPKMPVPSFEMPTKYATVADRLFTYLSTSGLGEMRPLKFEENNVPGAEKGDLIFYSWNDQDVENLVMDHAMIITSFSDDSSSDYRYAQMTGHSDPTKDQGWTWSKARNGWIEDVYRDSLGHKPTAWLMRITY